MVLSTEMILNLGFNCKWLFFDLLVTCYWRLKNKKLSNVLNILFLYKTFGVWHNTNFHINTEEFKRNKVCRWFVPNFYFLKTG